MRVITAVENYKINDDEITVFLAGGITNCKDWQTDVINELKKYNDIHNNALDKLVIFNPRRQNFPKEIHNANYEQILWEFNALNIANIFSMYFAESTSDQPICMYELGRNIIHMQMNYPKDYNKRIIITCDPKYKRAEDVKIQTELAWLNGKAEINQSSDLVKHASLIIKAYNHIKNSNIYNINTTKDIKEDSDDNVSNLVYQSLFDEALNMAYTLQDIDAELRLAAQCEGDYPGGYPSERLLPSLCKIMYADFGYWKSDKYNMKNK